MGNWHCIPSNCAEVVYQEYLSPVVRWRYPGEQWQEIVGDDYKFEGQPQFSQTEPKAYRIWAKAKILSRVPPPPDTKPPQPIRYNPGEEILCTVNTFFQSPIWSVRPITNSAGSWLWEVTHTPTTGGNQFRGNCVKQIISFPVGTPRSNGTLEGLDSKSNQVGPGVGGFYDWYLVEDKTVTLRQCINQQNFSCTFTVTKNGQTVHTETRAVCPEVEKLPCKLSDVRHSIEIKKLPYLEKVEVVPYAYSAYKSPGVPAPIVQADQIPNECLNIYNNAIYVIPPFGQAIYPNATPFDSFITQICSYPGCPPPEYQVICDCNNCQSCPEGTCPIECNGNICCYNDYGVSIKEIPLSNYCGGQS